jgi:hypothetical protein
MQTFKSGTFLSLIFKFNTNTILSGLISLIITSIDLLKHSTNISYDADDELEMASSQLMKLNIESFLHHTQGIHYNNLSLTIFYNDIFIIRTHFGKI